MATFEREIIDQLTSRMMPDDAAREVLEAVKLMESNASMDGKWNHDTSEYPSTILAVIWMNAKDEALKWIDKNKPKAFYRPLFERN